MNSAAVRLGVDIGGTFTDLVLEVADRSLSVKTLTTHDAPEDAIIAGTKKVCDQAGIDPAKIDQIIHGTTLATNALIERRGAKTALITTAGFRDVIEMRTESRFEQYDLNLTTPEALLPREQRFTLAERIGASGEVLIPLARSDVEALVREIVEQKFESVAVGLLHSYLNDAHEQLIATVFKELAPNLMLSLSCEVSPQMREYERFNTVAANAYIKPLMKSYLNRLEDRLQGIGVACPVFLMHSGGGIISLASAAEFPVRLVESGPAGGAVFAAHIAAQRGLRKVLSFDMGGTTAKICMINDHTPKRSRVFEVARTYRFKKGSGMPISIPVIDMVEIGAGGGSLARVDELQQIRVGPESAGSQPGPACYGKGGTRPAVTDADLLLGKLDPNEFAGGSMQLDEAGAGQAIDQAIGEPLALATQIAAHALVEVVDENMANAARVHAVENGEDLAGFTMIAFGGAAPLHAARLCEKLGIDTLLVPLGAGVGSAIGFLRAPYSFEATRSTYMRLSEFEPDRVSALLTQLRSEATTFVRKCAAQADIHCEYKAYMRYAGQGWEIPVEFAEADAQNADVERFRSLFEDSYRTIFNRVVAGMDVEITLWAVNASTQPAAVEHYDNAASLKTKSVTAAGSRQLFDAATGTSVTAKTIPRAELAAGDCIDGPVMITEVETTLVVPTGRRAVMGGDGCIEVVPNSEGSL